MRTEPQETKRFFSELYDTFHDEIFRFSLAKTRNRDLALDITQETFIKTWDYLRSGKHIEQARGFLYRTCRNLIIDMSRKKKFASLDALLEGGELSSVNDSSLELPDSHIDKELFMGRLRLLDEHHFEILHLRFIQELTLSEIAQIYKENENTISVRIHRAVKQAKKLFADIGEEFYEN
jgi:RNA polymerase sigma-70 factor (ECF subfamily)